MNALQQFISNFDLEALINLVIRVAAVMLCITVHETSHGLAARWMGDNTAYGKGRLSLNPLRHIDPLGFLMMLLVGFGWAKPVPVNPRNFRHPKRGMAITALAGPISNFLLATVILGICSALVHTQLIFKMVNSDPGYWLYMFLLRTVILSVGLGLFNLLPIPPLDGSKVLFSLLPERIYFRILRYERYLSLALFAVLFFGVLDGPLNAAILVVLRALCAVTGFPGVLLGI